MHTLARVVSLLALCAVSSLCACKEGDGGSSPPAEVGAGVVAEPAEPAEVVAEPAEVVEVVEVVERVIEPVVVGDAAAVEGGAAGVVCTADMRKGGMCTREYQPVCGSLADGSSRTYPNKCVACSDEQVRQHVAGACPGEP